MAADGKGMVVEGRAIVVLAYWLVFLLAVAVGRRGGPAGLVDPLGWLPC